MSNVFKQKINTEVIMVLIVSLEGNIGSGKTTFFEYLKECHFIKKVSFCEEPVKVWETIKNKDNKNILECFYGDQVKYSFHFQMVAYISRLNLLKETLKENPDIIITERSLYTDLNVFAKMLYESDHMSLLEYNIYNKWFSNFLNDIPNIYYVYINTSPAICEQRITLRARQGENVPLAYLVKCKKYHDTWFDKMKLKNYLMINGDIDASAHTLWKNKLDQFIENLNNDGVQ
jgi:deoxyadenosine/deoxycytidine kinase